MPSKKKRAAFIGYVIGVLGGSAFVVGFIKAYQIVDPTEKATLLIVAGTVMLIIGHGEVTKAK